MRPAGFVLVCGPSCSVLGHRNPTGQIAQVRVYHRKGPVAPTPSPARLTSLNKFTIHRLRTYTADCRSGTQKPLPPVALNLRGDTTLQTVPDNVFLNSSELAELVLPATVTTVKANALTGCTSLRRLDMSLCAGLTKLPGHFLRGCTALEEVILPSNITHLGANFMCVNNPRTRTSKKTPKMPPPKLRRLDLSALTSLKEIPPNFMVDCESLEELLLPPSITTIREGFLRGCHSLKRLDLSALCGLIRLPNVFLPHCTNLQELTLSSYLEVLPYGFLIHCTSLKRLDLSALTKVKVISWEFLRCCESLEELLLPPSITSIYANFSGCSSLKRLDLSALCGLTELPSKFLVGCTGLEELLLPPSITTIGEGFLNNCTSLKRLDMSMLANVTLGNGFMRGCTSLEEVLVPPSINAYGDDLFADCRNLAKIDVRPLLKARYRRGNRLLSGCNALSVETVELVRRSLLI